VGRSEIATRLRTSRMRRALGKLHDRPLNFWTGAAPDASGGGWTVDHYRQPLPPERPGEPTPGGSWTIAQRLLRDYAFADPKIVRAVFDPEQPFEGRDMLIQGRFLGLRFHLGVRVGGVVDTQREIGGRPVQVWGWDYKTLEGHLEAGQMDYEVRKWMDTGEVEFHIRRAVRTGEIPNLLVRFGWAVFGRFMQVRFARRACARMQALVVSALERASVARPAADPNVSPQHVFRFRFHPLYRVAAGWFGVRPARAWVTVGGGRLQARFGPWFVDTPLVNVVGWETTGPYSRLETIGPAHLSLADRGLTFATNRERGLCIRFREPVGGIDPRHRLRHPGLTVTVADVSGLAAALREMSGAPA
jgi:hypothetical protein